MDEKEKTSETSSDFGYMEQLSKAYEAAFSERRKASDLPEEKRELLLKMQHEIALTAKSAALSFGDPAKKELALMVKESAEEILAALSSDELPSSQSGAMPESALSRAVLLANRSLNLLLRHNRCIRSETMLVLSELSALYALAAIR